MQKTDPDYDNIVIGAGVAGLSAALYTSRLNHPTLVIDKGGGRINQVRHVHNYIGVTDDNTGDDLQSVGIDQVKKHGGEFVHDKTVDATKEDGVFHVETDSGDVYTSRALVVATGMMDVFPQVPGLGRFNGHEVHYCLHCDAHLCIDEDVFVLGDDDHAAVVALILLNFTDDVTFLTNGETPELSEEYSEKIEANGIDVVEKEIACAEGDEHLERLVFEDGESRKFDRGFAMLGGRVNNGILESLGAELNDSGYAVIDDDAKTDIDGLYAVGDVTDENNQIPIGVGKGAKAGLDIHKSLREFP
ncbi:NAD(P)/FAD-dependent oxidoreductase [Halorutilales archaeon Cl-col2-1]